MILTLVWLPFETLAGDLNTRHFLQFDFSDRGPIP
jgi:hypothetical protein